MAEPGGETPQAASEVSDVSSALDAIKSNDPNDFVSVVSEAGVPMTEVSERAPSAEGSDPRDAEMRRLREELASLRLQRSPSTPPDIEALKKQYEGKLKDVMEKARDHAKKLASERDELKKQVEEREGKVANFKQLMAAASSDMNSKDARILELEEEARSSSSRVKKLEDQMTAMEAHYTKPPTGKLIATLSVRDATGTEWILVQDRWWKRVQLGDDLSVQAKLDSDQLRAHQREVDGLQKQLEGAHKEFQDYKKKVEVVLQGRSVSSTPVESEEGLKSVKKIMKLEAEAVQNMKTITELRGQVSELQSSEKSLVAQVASAKQEIARLVEPVNALEQQISTLRADKKTLSEKLHQARDKIAELSRKVEDARIASVVLAEQRSASETALSSETVESVPFRPDVATTGTQTDFAPTILFQESPQPTPVSPQQPPSRPELVNAQHDSVAMPLRQQIRELILELEAEKHEHAMTAEQLSVVKEELRKIEAEKKLGADLNDPVKVEYMRNVARKFIALAPTADDEFEQLIPVILTFFGLEGHEAVALLKERKRRLQSSSSSIQFPKLW